MSLNILVVDLETTSINPRQADILEVGLANVDLGSGKIELVSDTLICPESDEEGWLECWFMANSKLDPEVVRQAPKFSSVRKEVQRQVSELPVTAFNLNYDVQVLHRHQVQVPKRAPCLMLVCKDILCLPGYYGDYKYPKFSEAWQYFFPNEPFEEKHRAGYDAIHEARLAIALYERGYLKNAFVR